MKEDVLQLIWKFGLINLVSAYTVNGQKVEIVHPGQHNKVNSGPDFFSAKVRVNGVLWVGNVEVHSKTSDWYKHLHQFDSAYQNVILHVVYSNDVDFEIQGMKVPVLELKKCVDPEVWDKVNQIEKSKAKISCSKWIHNVSPIDWVLWKDRLLVERFERKSAEVKLIYEANGKNWEHVTYTLLCKSLGGTVNKMPFQILSRLLPVEIIKKHADNLLVIEALVFGVAGLLEGPFKDIYPNKLKSEFNFYRHKYKLKVMEPTWWKWLRLRPVSFPTIQLALLASCIHHNKRIDALFEFANFKTFYKKMFASTQVSLYWENHYKFDKISKEKPKNWGEEVLKRIYINALIPYQIARFENMETAMILEQLCEIKAEKNSLTKKWEDLGVKIKTAFDSQALIQLSNDYCSQKKCLNCNIGLKVLKSN